MFQLKDVIKEATNLCNEFCKNNNIDAVNSENLLRVIINFIRSDSTFVEKNGDDSFGLLLDLRELQYAHFINLNQVLLAGHISILAKISKFQKKCEVKFSDHQNFIDISKSVENANQYLASASNEDEYKFREILKAVNNMKGGLQIRILDLVCKNAEFLTNNSEFIGKMTAAEITALIDSEDEESRNATINKAAERIKNTSEHGSISSSSGSPGSNKSDTHNSFFFSSPAATQNLQEGHYEYLKEKVSEFIVNWAKERKFEEIAALTNAFLNNQWEEVAKCINITLARSEINKLDR